MISINDAIKIVEDITNEKVIKVSDYKNDFFLLLVQGGSPFYIVKKDNGDSRFLNPMEDFKELVDSLNNKVLKILIHQNTENGVK